MEALPIHWFPPAFCLDLEQASQILPDLVRDGTVALGDWPEGRPISF